MFAKREKTNWCQIYAVIQIYAIVGGAAVGNTVFWAMIIVEICRIEFKLNENDAMALIRIVLAFIKVVQKHLCEAGILSDEPKNLGLSSSYEDREI